MTTEQTEQTAQTAQTGSEAAPREGSEAGPNLGRMVKIALLVFALALAGVAVAAWVSGGPETLPFEYEGFD